MRRALAVACVLFLMAVPIWLAYTSFGFSPMSWSDIGYNWLTISGFWLIVGGVPALYHVILRIISCRETPRERACREARMSTSAPADRTGPT